MPSGRLAIFLAACFRNGRSIGFNDAHGVAPDKSMGGYVLMYERAGGYDRVIADRHAGKNRAIRPDHHMIADHDIPDPIFFDEIFMSQYRRIIADYRISSNPYPFGKKHVYHHHEGESGMLPHLHPQDSAIDPVLPR